MTSLIDKTAAMPAPGACDFIAIAHYEYRSLIDIYLFTSSRPQAAPGVEGDPCARARAAMGQIEFGLPLNLLVEGLTAINSYIRLLAPNCAWTVWNFTKQNALKRGSAMKVPKNNLKKAGAVACAIALALGLSVRAQAADEEAARALARQSNCFKCHAVDKKKEAPPWREVAAKYKGKPDAEAKLIHHITSGERVKFADGHEEDHKIVASKDPAEIKNLVDWILSL